MPDSLFLFPSSRTEISPNPMKLNPHPPDSFHSSLNEKTDIVINLLELLDLLMINNVACRRQGMPTQVWTPSRLMRRNRIEYRLLLFVQNIKVNLGGELCVFVCLIVCVAGCNKPNETFEVCCPHSIMFDLWKLRALSRLLADLLWLRCDLVNRCCSVPVYTCINSF